MQLCALLSQLHRHQEALYHGQIAVRISHFLLRDLKSYIKSLVYRENYGKLEKDSKLSNKKDDFSNSKKSSSRIELKSNQSLKSLNENKSKIKGGDGAISGDINSKEQDLGKVNKGDEQESTDSMDGEVETMSILVKGYKKIYPLIEFLEKFLVFEYLDDEDNFNGPPVKIIPESDSDSPENTTDINNRIKNKEGKPIESVILNQQKKFIKAQLKEAVKEEGLNAENLLGFINQRKLNSYLNISNIMRLKKLDFKDVYSTVDMDIYLIRESVLERFMFVISSYFCMGTELRFLKQLKVQGFKDSIEAQFWHGRALEMGISLFPGDSPLVKHIIQSYQKHHAPSSEIIPEDYSISHEVKVAKPLLGVHSNKAYPLIQN